MKGGWQRLLVIAGLLSGLACGSDSLTAPSAAGPSGPYTLSGNVSEDSAEGKRPSRGALVRASFSAGDRTVATGEDGSFAIGGLPGGLVHVSVSKPGYDEAATLVDMKDDLVLELELWRSERPRVPPAI